MVRDAFLDLVAAHDARLLRLCRRLARDAEDARDLRQDVLLEAYVSLPALRDAGRAWPWLRTIAVRRALRTRRATLLELDALIDEVPAPDGDPAMSVAVRDAIAALPSAQREAAIGRLVAGHSYADLAARAGVPVSTIRGRVARARRTLRAALADPIPDPGGCPRWPRSTRSESSVWSSPPRRRRSRGAWWVCAARTPTPTRSC